MMCVQDSVVKDCKLTSTHVFTQHDQFKFNQLPFSLWITDGANVKPSTDNLEDWLDSVLDD